MDHDQVSEEAVRGAARTEDLRAHRTLQEPIGANL